MWTNIGISPPAMWGSLDFNKTSLRTTNPAEPTKQRRFLSASVLCRPSSAVNTTLISTNGGFEHCWTDGYGHPIMNGIPSNSCVIPDIEHDHWSFVVDLYTYSKWWFSIAMWKFPKMGVPLFIIHFSRIFHEKTIQLLGYQHDYGNLHFWRMRFFRMLKVELVNTTFYHMILWFSLPKGNTSWWFQPLWKILVNWDDYFQYTEEKKCPKPPTRLVCYSNY